MFTIKFCLIFVFVSFVLEFYLHVMADKYAEKNGHYIFKALRTLSEISPNTWHEYEYDTSKTVSDKPGIYMFYIRDTIHKYPVYFGKTETGFKTRFADHQNNKDGVIYRYLNKPFPTFPKDVKEQELQLEVVLVTMSTPFIIKLAESLFLCAFDFALNKMENGKERDKIDDISQFKALDSYRRDMEQKLSELEAGVSSLKKALEDV